ncbi:hypothetical protein HanXRQr2_Chr09g0416621 [Helianthus annuus]|uniref:Uncharacterized protein n=1 Tax=Helianthus annuus TaxID=4232 RepID=A0A251U1E3_HELAN|nr:hypothetical protein HanXRQr2_Chr09g0416621 [Helianthus annuus]KAJ0528207.1 hypothetical protein HanHA300_Chr09g0342611 [Helianthus annuus]KAJ0544636.1 hypothetical protein HanHA89_Chr09g0363841 [Helianthus annuus]
MCQARRPLNFVFWRENVRAIIFSRDPNGNNHTRYFDPGYIKYLTNLNHSFASFHALTEP